MRSSTVTLEQLCRQNVDIMLVLRTKNSFPLYCQSCLEVMVEALKAIRERSPFNWLGINSDNDQMFINDQLFKYYQQEELEFTRSRPYRKNDNAYIEQKNYTHVRRPLGYLRYETEEELHLINDLYRNELRLYKNFFQPVMKLDKKERVDGRVRRKYERSRFLIKGFWNQENC